MKNTMNEQMRMLLTGSHRAAVYCRLSKDDDLQGESASIANQRAMLETYCEQQGWEVVEVYQDDSYTGLNMERPALQRMLKAVECKQVNIVLTKDLSRLGRNYLQTGYLIEDFFPRHGVRYIATNDGIDTMRESNDIAPFKNILNEVYSKDIRPEDWIVVEGQHEALIDRSSFEVVQEKLRARQRPRQNGEVSLFAGLLKCGECGKSLTIRATNAKHPKQIYVCKTYNAYGKNHCTQHRVEYNVLYKLVLDQIRECAQAALQDEGAVAGRLSDAYAAEQSAQREMLKRSLAKDEERVEMLDKMVLRLYEDRMEGRISEENFDLMLRKTQAEQAQLKERAARDRKKLADEEQLVCDARQWAEAIREYSDITELDAATLHRLVKEIVVHEQIDADNTRHITIEIHFNLKPIAATKPVTA